MRKPLRVIMGNMVPDHFALLVQPGMMNSAVSFWVDQLGWEELKDRRTNAEWGKVRFVKPRVQSTVVFQLTELAGDSHSILPGVHPGLKVYDANEAAVVIEEWAAYCGIPCETEEVANGKWFVTLPSIFATNIEFVSADA